MAKKFTGGLRNNWSLSKPNGSADILLDYIPYQDRTGLRVSSQSKKTKILLTSCPNHIVNGVTLYVRGLVHISYLYQHGKEVESLGF